MPATLAAAEPRCSCNPKCLSHRVVESWHTYRSENFEISCRTALTDVDAVIRRCEQTRALLRATWLGDYSAEPWAQPCRVVVHTSAADYTRQTGISAQTKGVTSMEIGNGTVFRRRIDLLADKEGWSDALIPHELTHVVLADRFCRNQIPRWADEGVAIVNEHGPRLAKAVESVDLAIRAGRAIPLTELITAASYPPEKERAELFFAQSAAFVAFLVSRNGEQEVLRFAESTHSADAAKGTFRLPDTTDLHTLERDFANWTRERDAALPQLYRQQEARRVDLLALSTEAE